MSGPLDAITIPSNPPPELKARCDHFLKRAAETKKAEPVVSYWCTLAAAEAALELKERSNEGTTFLLSLMDTLEAMKAALADNEAVTSAAAGAAYVENFALRVFMNADNMDRAGKYDKSVIRAFLAASQFFAVLKSCNGGVLLEEMEEKQSYARWKAADLARALREGREPVHGPPVPDEPEELAGLPSTSGLGSPPAVSSPPVGSPPVSSPGLHRPNAPPTLDMSSTEPTGLSGTWSTMATPGVDGHEGSDESLSRITSPPVTSPPLTSPPVASPSLIPKGETTPVPSPKKGSDKALPTSPEKEKKNVRFMGPDGAPLSPSESTVSVQHFNEPSAPPPSEIGLSSAPSAPPQSPPKVPPKSSSKATSPPTHSAKPTPSLPKSVSSSKSSPPAPQPPSKPQSPPKFQIAPAVQRFGVLAPAQEPQGAAAKRLSRKETETVQKHAKWAISALDYDDVETARKELLKALEMLG